MDEIMQQYIDECSKLPTDLRKNFDLIRQIDVDVEQKAELVQEKVVSLTKSHRGLSKDAQQALHKEVQKLFDEILSMSEKKLKLATVTYNVVDDQIVRLDRDTERAHTIVKRKIEPEDGTQKRKRKQSRKRGKSQTDVEAEASTSNGFVHNGGIPGIDLPIDPNEPVYCICRQVSFGNMVMCDNKDCPVEWFHFACVGLTETPKGRWYCPTCSAEKSKKKSLNVSKNDS